MKKILFAIATLLLLASCSDGQVEKQSFTVEGVSFTMIKVDPGTFMMGCAPNQEEDSLDREQPRHLVILSQPYYIGETQVTQALWEAVMGNNPSYFTGDLQRPVESVSWNDCQEFIEKLNELTGKQFTLPTEAQWEYAARGGNRRKGFKYAGSDDVDEVAWWDGNSNEETHPVKTKAPNELGIYDMSGNVWEWCQDCYDSYPQSSVTDPLCASGSYRVFRGGSWCFNAQYCRSSHRNYYFPDRYGCNGGFRLAFVP